MLKTPLVDSATLLSVLMSWGYRSILTRVILDGAMSQNRSELMTSLSKSLESNSLISKERVEMKRKRSSSFCDWTIVNNK